MIRNTNEALIIKLHSPPQRTMRQPVGKLLVSPGYRDSKVISICLFRTDSTQTSTRNGEALVAKNSAMKIAHGRRRETFPLGTPNKAAVFNSPFNLGSYVSEQLDDATWEKSCVSSSIPTIAVYLDS
jgi:hypothetical protein